MKAAVILSGCGHLDGAEIRESVLALLALDQQGVTADVFAPDTVQMHVVDHVKQSPTKESRNVMEEAARIARGNIKPLSKLDMAQYDLLVIPGGYGVAKNLSDFALKGSQGQASAEFKAAAEAAFSQKKPIAAICIAPAVLALALKDKGITVTIGEDTDVAAAIVANGNFHKDCASDGCVIDEKNRIVSCSAYMRDDALALIAKGIDACIKAAVSMAKNSKKAAA